MKTYSEKLKDPRWQKKRLEVMQRDRFTCRDCGDKTNTLHVHHCHYEKGEPWETDTKFLLTLCARCHEIRQGHEEAIKQNLGTILANTTGGEDGGYLKPLLESMCCAVKRQIADPYVFSHDDVSNLYYEMTKARSLMDRKAG